MEREWRRIQGDSNAYFRHKSPTKRLFFYHFSPSKRFSLGEGWRRIPGMENSPFPSHSPEKVGEKRFCAAFVGETQFSWFLQDFASSCRVVLGLLVVLCCFPFFSGLHRCVRCSNHFHLCFQKVRSCKRSDFTCATFHRSLLCGGEPSSQMPEASARS